MANDNTTGHVWDEDLREMNNPLPRWWMWLFVITVVFSAVYLAFYPGLGTYAGTLKWTSTGQHEAEQDKARQAMAPVYAKYAGHAGRGTGQGRAGHGHRRAPVHEQLRAVPRLRCRGSKGFPNLADGDWLHGGTHDKIKETITKGRRA
jgi:cytochrome c oxidase cbb3-type subunit 3